MSETNETIASLRSSIEALHSLAVTLQMQVSGKADASAVSALASRVTACEGRVAACGSQVTAQGAPITAQARAVSSLSGTVTAERSAVSMLTTRVAGQSESVPAVDRSGYITGEKPARQAMEEVFSRAKADLALAQRIGSFECTLPEGTVKCTLGTEVVSSDDQASQGESPFAVIDPARFKVETDKLRIDHAVIDGYRVILAVNEQGQYYIAGVGLGASTVANGLRLGPSLEEDVRRLLRDELKPGGLLHRS